MNHKKKNLIVRFLGAFKASIATYTKISLYVEKQDRLKFYFKILFSQLFVSLNPVSKIEKDILFKHYSFNYTDWFSDNINVFKKYLSTLDNFNYLEIGTFEGRSAVYISQLRNCSNITCVDSFKGSDEHKSIEINLVYKNFKKNLGKIKKKISFIKKSSDNFFLKNNKKFDVIYIDGSHFYKDVKKDLNNSIKCLNRNGILICDDFLWFGYKNIRDNPLVAILNFFYSYKHKLEILFINYQVIFRKK